MYGSRVTKGMCYRDPTPSYLALFYCYSDGLFKSVVSRENVLPTLDIRHGPFQRVFVEQGTREVKWDVPKEGIVLKNGWSITPIDTSEIPQYLGGRPCCSLRVKWTRPEECPVKLCHRIRLFGARPPDNFITLQIEPPLPQSQIRSILFGSPSHPQIGSKSFRSPSQPIRSTSLGSLSQPQIGSTPQLQIGSASRSQIGSTSRSQIGSTSRSQIGSTSRSQIGSTSRSQIGSTSRSQIGQSQIRSTQIGSTSQAQIGSTSRSQIGSTSQSQIGSTSRSQIGSTSRSQIGQSQIRSTQIGSTSQSQIGSTSRSQIGSTSRSQIGQSQIRSTQIGSTSRSQIGSTSPSQIGSQLPQSPLLTAAIISMLKKEYLTTEVPQLSLQSTCNPWKHLATPLSYAEKGETITEEGVPPAKRRKQEQSAAKKPTLAKLMKMKTITGEKVHIINSVAPHWKQLGALLDFDDKGRTLSLIEADNQQKGHVACCQEMFTLWLNGKGKKATWEVLLELLVDIDQSELARKVKAALHPF